MTVQRSFSALCSYPGMKKFHFGTVVMPARATMQEIREALQREWCAISPHPMPDMEPLPGMVMFIAEDRA